MDFCIADTFTDSLAKLTGDEQAAGDGARDHHPRVCGDAGEQKVPYFAATDPFEHPIVTFSLRDYTSTAGA